METVIDIVSWVAISGGGLFAMIGGLGVLRLPDVFARMHGAGITDTLGAGLILIGLAVQSGFTLVAVKLILILVFLFLTSPTATYALANAAMTAGLRPITGPITGKKDRTPS